jgi:DNA invertase Pin-like site-specific DNA recombinase
VVTLSPVSIRFLSHVNVGLAVMECSMSDPFVAYYRVSTHRQGRSGLGLEAQQRAVRDYLSGGIIVGEFTEIESGNERPELAKALAACRKHKAKLLIARLDRLSRNLAFVATLMDAGVEFIAADNPHANKLTVHIIAAVAQHEREMIADRTRAALQAAKMRGARLCRNAARLAPIYREQANQRARQLGPLLLELQTAGLSAQRTATELNSRQVPTPMGKKWHAQSVIRLLRRFSPAVG